MKIEINEEVYAKKVNSREVSDVIRSLWSNVFDDQEGICYFRIPTSRENKVKGLLEIFDKIHHEDWVFYTSKDEAIGWSIGEMEDNMTFYMRNSGIISAYRRQGIYSKFLKEFMKYISEMGYERITSHHQLNNNAVIIPKLKSGFQIVGTEIDERFGAQIKMVHFIHDDRRMAHNKLFSLGNR